MIDRPADEFDLTDLYEDGDPAHEALIKFRKMVERWQPDYSDDIEINTIFVGLGQGDSLLSLQIVARIRGHTELVVFEHVVSLMNLLLINLDYEVWLHEKLNRMLRQELDGYAAELEHHWQHSVIS